MVNDYEHNKRVQKQHIIMTTYNKWQNPLN